MLSAANDAGFGNVALTAEPLAAAMGADLPVKAATGSMIIKCGAGITEVAVFSLGSLCGAGTVRIGGATLDQAVADQLHVHHKFIIGNLTAEQLELDYFARRQNPGCKPADTLLVRGRCLRAALPKTIAVDVAELDKVSRSMSSK